jgi:hypothetical protein
MADVEQFMVVTGADEQTAKEFLQGANGDVEAAVNLFFVSSGAAEEEVPELEAPAPLTTSTGGAGPSISTGATLAFLYLSTCSAEEYMHRRIGSDARVRLYCVRLCVSF